MVGRTEIYNNGLEKLLGKTGMSAKNSEKSVYNRYTGEIENVKLSAKQKMALKLKGFVYLGERQYPGWTGKIGFYLYKCKVKDKEVLMLDYPHSYADSLRCSI